MERIGGSCGIGKAPFWIAKVPGITAHGGRVRDHSLNVKQRRNFLEKYEFEVHQSARKKILSLRGWVVAGRMRFQSMRPLDSGPLDSGRAGPSMSKHPFSLFGWDLGFTDCAVLFSNGAATKVGLDNLVIGDFEWSSELIDRWLSL